MKRFGVVSCALIVALALSACGEGGAPAQPVGQQQRTYTLKLAYAAAESSTTGRVAAKVKELLEARTSGKIKVEIYPNSQLGGDRELTEGCQAGNISMVTQATAPQASFVPAAAVFDIPSVLTDVQAASRMLSGLFRDKISEHYSKAGLRLLMAVPAGFREMSSNKAVRKMEDFKGVKIRTMENQFQMAYWRALGANPIPLAFSELYVALQQGLVDAQENPPEVLIVSKLHEQQKYLINTHHIMFVSTYVMNKGLYDGMPAEYRKVIDEVMKECGDLLVRLSMENTDISIRQLKDLGKEIIDLPAEEHARMKEAAKPVHDMIRKAVGDDLVDTLLKEYDAASKQ